MYIEILLILLEKFPYLEFFLLCISLHSDWIPEIFLIQSKWGSPYSEFFCFVFSRIRTEYEDLQSKMNKNFLATLLKNAPTQLLSSEYCKIFKNIYFEELLRMADSERVFRTWQISLMECFSENLAKDSGVDIYWHFRLEVLMKKIFLNISQNLPKTPAP